MISNVNSYFTDQDSNESWNISLDGYFKTCIAEQLLQDDMPEDAVDTIFQNSVETLSQCPNPDDKKPNGKTGIIIGRVQSGKTSNFLSLVALAFDNGYDITVILGGNTNNLVDQNYERIKATFFKASKEKKVAILSSTTNVKLLNPKSIKQLLDDEKKVILVGLKHPKHINQIAKIFDDVNLSNRPTLIIDDEGDQATFNTNHPTKKQEEEQKKKDSATYSAVRNLKDLLKRHCLISVTATPQANILVSKLDFLSPDFGTLVYPGKGYCGLNEFHGENSEKHVKIIPDEDTATLLLDNQIPSSLTKALAAFFVSGAIRQYRDGDISEHSMLIHPEVKKEVHGAILDLVEDLMDDWKARAKVRNDGDDAYSQLRKDLVEAYEDYVNDGVQLPPFEVLEDKIVNGILKSHTHLCNSDMNTSADAEYYDFNIFVGGNMLGRGITLPKLTITYITRRAKGIANVDNTEQRARWFGYRNADKPYFDLCRVYATENISNDFSAILEHEEDLWCTIKDARRNGIAFKNMSRIFKLPNKLLRATRPTVNKTKFLHFSPCISQGYLSSSPSIANANDELISKFRNLHPPKIDLEYDVPHPNHIVRGLNFYDVCTELLMKYKYPKESHLDSKYLEKLCELLKKTEGEIGIPLVDVIWIRPEIGSARKILDGRKIEQLFQGHNANYPGDRDLPNNGIQLQIHYVRPKNYSQSPEINCKLGSPVLSLCLSSKYTDALDRKYTTIVDEED